MVDKDINIEKIKIDSLVPADYNPRKISDKDYENLKNSIDEFGIVSPIIINLADNTIISGHQRFDVLYYENNINDLYLIRLGDIGWVFTETDLTIKDKNYEKTLNLALNRIHGEFDEEKLNSVLVELEELKLDKLTGFDLELDDIDYDFIDRIEDVYDEDEDYYEDEIVDDDEVILSDVLEDDEYEEEYEEEIFDDEETIEEVGFEETSEKHDNKTDRIRRGFIKYGDIYKIGDSYLMFGKENNGQDRTKLLNVNVNKTPDISQGLNKIKTTHKEINYYISDDAELIENIIIKHKKISKRIK